MLEREVQKKAVKFAKVHGWWAKKFVAQGRRSAPDYIFAKNGRVFWTEFKATGDEPTKLQSLEHEDMRAHGLTVYVCDDPFDFLTFVLSTEDGLASKK